MTKDYQEPETRQSLLQREEELFRAAFEQSPMSTQILSPEGRTLWVNKAWEELWGVTLEQLGDYNMLEDQQLVEKGIMPYIKKAFAGERTEIPPILYNPEETIPNLTIHEEPGRWVRAFTFPVKDESGKIREIVLMHEDITARRRAEETAQRWAGVFEHVQWGAVMVSEDGSKLVMMNPAYASMHGYTVEELIGKPLIELFAPEARAELAEHIRATRERGHHTFESLHMRRDGTAFPVLVESTAVKERDGQVAYLAAHVQDITDRKKIEEELRRGEEKYRNLLENANDIIYAHDLQGNYLTINRACEEITGYTRKEILGGLNIAQVVAPEHLELAKEMTRRKLSDPSPTVYEVDIITKDGRRLTIEVSTRIAWRDGEPVAVEGIARDVTERKRAEAALRFLAEASGVIASSLDYETTLASVAHMVVPTLADWCTVDVLEDDRTLKRLAVAHVNPEKVEWAYELQKRYPADMDSPRGIPNVLRTGEPEIYPEIADEMLVAGAIDDEHLKIMRDVGFTSAIIVPLVTQGRTLGVITLISAESRRKFGQEDLALAQSLAHRAAIAIENARLYRSAQEANRLKDEFLATVSHELRTPLTAILGWAYLLRAGQIDQGSAATALETIERNARSQAQIIDDLLDVSRIITGKLRLDVREVDPASFIESAIEAVHPAAEAKGVRIQKVIDTGIISIAGDPSRLQQVVWNLLSNAIKFTPKGGRVQIRLERVNSHIEIVVTDTGSGIKADFLPHVFERFRQADSSTTRAHGGLGLGLAIVRHLAELHGGTVSAESDGVGRGASFTVRLPQANGREETTALPAAGESRAEAAPPAASRAGDSPAGEPDLTGVRVLVVEDEPDTLEILRVALGQYGAQVRTASSSERALEAFSEWKPDVLVSDLGMPGEDGFTLIRKVRSLAPEQGGAVPAAALTAYVREEDRLRTLEAGYQAHVPKPIEPTALASVVAGLARRAPRA